MGIKTFRVEWQHGKKYQQIFPGCFYIKQSLIIRPSQGSVCWKTNTHRASSYLIPLSTFSEFIKIRLFHQRQIILRNN